MILSLLRWWIRQMKDWQVFCLRDAVCCRCTAKGTGVVCLDHFKEMMAEHDEYKASMRRLDVLELEEEQ